MVIPDYYEFQNSAKICSGKHALQHIGHELTALGATRPLVVTSKDLIDLGVATHVIDAIADSEAEVAGTFDGVPVDSSVEVVNGVAAMYRDRGADAIVAVGGGSVLDTAKGATIVLTHGGDDLMAYAGAETLMGGRTVPFIAVPTTSGTGSEATSAAVIKDTDRQVKMAFTSLTLLPDVAILDPTLLVKLPPRLTASTAMDALTHAVEAYSCSQANPVSDCYARAAIDLIREYLPLALDKPRNHSVRLALANAALLAGVAFSNAMVGIVHAMGHAAGGIARVPHGEAMALLLPHGMAYNLDVAGERYADLLLNIAGAEVYASTPPEDRAERAIEAVRDLLGMLAKRTHIPLTLCEAGVLPEQIEDIAKAALNDGAMAMNPKQPDLDELMEVLKGAL